MLFYMNDANYFVCHGLLRLFIFIRLQYMFLRTQTSIIMLLTFFNEYKYWRTDYLYIYIHFLLYCCIFSKTYYV